MLQRSRELYSKSSSLHKEIWLPLSEPPKSESLKYLWKLQSLERFCVKRMFYVCSPSIFEFYCVKLCFLLYYFHFVQ